MSYWKLGLYEEQHLIIKQNEIYVLAAIYPDIPGYWSEEKQDWVPLMEASVLIRHVTRFWAETITFDEALKREGYTK